MFRELDKPLQPTAPSVNIGSPLSFTGDRVVHDYEAYSRLRIDLHVHIKIESPKSNPIDILHKVCGLIVAEMFYESQVSPVVLKFMVSFFMSESLRSPHNLSGGNLGWYVKQFRLRMYTRNPCIKTVLINTIKTKNSRGFSIPGTISTSGFVSYCFNGDVREVYLSADRTLIN